LKQVQGEKERKRGKIGLTLSAPHPCRLLGEKEGETRRFIDDMFSRNRQKGFPSASSRPRDEVDLAFSSGGGKKGPGVTPVSRFLHKPTDYVKKRGGEEMTRQSISFRRSINQSGEEGTIFGLLFKCGPGVVKKKTVGPPGKKEKRKGGGGALLYQKRCWIEEYGLPPPWASLKKKEKRMGK